MNIQEQIEEFVDSQFNVQIEIESFKGAGMTEAHPTLAVLVEIDALFDPIADTMTKMKFALDSIADECQKKILHNDSRQDFAIHIQALAALEGSNDE